MTPASLALYGLIPVAIAALLLAVALALGVVFKLPRQGGLDIHNQAPLVRFVFVLVMAASLMLAVAIVALLVAGAWWLGTEVIVTPRRLVIISVVIAVLPLTLAFLASAIARAIGGTLHEGGYQDCTLLGFDLGPVLYQLFVMAWLSVFSGGLAIFGLIGAGIWYWAG